jgi:hypothetical protein
MMASRLFRVARTGACFVALFVAACGDGARKPSPSDPAADAGRETDDGGAVDPKPDGGEQPAPDGGPGRPDASAGDAGGDPDDPIEGGPGCGVGSLCLAVRVAYADAIQDAKSCSAGADESCGMKATMALGCESCEVWVTGTERLDKLRAQFVAGECDGCFYGSPTGDRCHPEGCNDLGAPMCAASGTCVPDLRCPESATNGASCADSELGYCGGDGKSCICFGDLWDCE